MIEGKERMNLFVFLYFLHDLSLFLEFLPLKCEKKPKKKTPHNQSLFLLLCNIFLSFFSAPTFHLICNLIHTFFHSLFDSASILVLLKFFGWSIHSHFFFLSFDSLLLNPYYIRNRLLYRSHSFPFSLTTFIPLYNSLHQSRDPTSSSLHSFYSFLVRYCLCKGCFTRVAWEQCEWKAWKWSSSLLNIIVFSLLVVLFCVVILATRFAVRDWLAIHSHNSWDSNLYHPFSLLIL